MQARLNRLNDIHEIGVYWYKLSGIQNAVFNHERAVSVRRFLDELNKADILDAVDIAHGKRPIYAGHDNATFRYFCGICWNKIKAAGNVE